MRCFSGRCLGLAKSARPAGEGTSSPSCGNSGGSRWPAPRCSAQRPSRWPAWEGGLRGRGAAPGQQRQSSTGDRRGRQRRSPKPIQNVLAEIPPQVHQRGIARRAARSLGSDPSLTPDQLLAATSVSVDQQSGLIRVTATASDPDAAARIANALAREYVDLRQARDLARIHGARVELQRIAEARAQSGSGDPTAASDLSSLTDRIEQLRLTEQLRPESVALTRPATPPSSRSGVAPWLIGAAGALLGFLIGIGILALRAQADQRIYSLRDLERALGAPVLDSHSAHPRAGEAVSSLAAFAPRGRALPAPAGLAPTRSGLRRGSQRRPDLSVGQRGQVDDRLVPGRHGGRGGRAHPSCWRRTRPARA